MQEYLIELDLKLKQFIQKSKKVKSLCDSYIEYNNSGYEIINDTDLNELILRNKTVYLDLKIYLTYYSMMPSGAKLKNNTLLKLDNVKCTFDKKYLFNFENTEIYTLN